ncbi:Uncharacterised protein [Candidatus Venteria ishoeyi]|uniref:Uncharacterized protein n=1 Tax=Candidatus Venteria ishoeyi TaxID=1899563 RepID=A0A1H6F810_9GAMM|nr:Uncharacterised protein [Candidatus Venteria ishoeyi]
MIYTAEIFVKKNKRSFEKKEITLITRTGFVFHAIVSVFLLWYTQQYFFNWFVIALYLFVYFFVTQTGLY